ncbi:MAG: FtsX-like permease family protein, partial [Acidimicrobiales bacterium]
GRNPLRGGDESVASRYMTKLPPPSSYSIAKGRLAAPGEAMAGKDAANALGLIDGAGAIASDVYSVPVVATVEFRAPLEFLNDTVVILGPDKAPTLIIALADNSDHVETLSKAVEEVLDPVRYESVRIESSTQLAAIRAKVNQDSGTSSASIITGALGTGLLLTAATSLGSVTVRRRDYGRRRALGATRSNIVVLVLAQSAVAATVGALIGSIVGLAAVVVIEGTTPDPLLVAGVGVLSINAAMLAAVPSAMLAALRDPVRILRVP